MGNTQQQEKLVDKAKEGLVSYFSKVPRESLQMQLEYGSRPKLLIPRKFLKSRLNYNEFTPDNHRKRDEDLENRKIKQWEKYVGRFQVHKRVLEEFTYYSARRRKSNTSNDSRELLKEIDQLKKQSPPLKKLNLNFSKISIRPEQMEIVTDYIGRSLSNLKHLRFYIPSYSISKKSLETVVSRHLINLKDLDLTFSSWDQIDQPSFENLLNQVCRSLIRLESLSLKFIHGDVLNKSVWNRSKPVKARSSNLKNISLSFKHCYKITFEGIRTLGFIQDCRSLKNLQLSFSECKDIDDKKFGLLMALMGKNLHTLELLSLRIFQSYHITDQSMKAIETKILPELVQLNALKLEFTGCPYVSKQGINELTDAIANLKLPLKELLLYFREKK